MKPTVGRIVYYHGDRNPKPDIIAAMVTAINPLTGDPSLVIFGVQGVGFRVDVKQGSEAGQWDWMPFQKDQQARIGYNNTPSEPEKVIE